MTRVGSDDTRSVCYNSACWYEGLGGLVLSIIPYGEAFGCVWRRLNHARKTQGTRALQGGRLQQAACSIFGWRKSPLSAAPHVVFVVRGLEIAGAIGAAVRGAR